jgi:formamidopyrimidine-DNA glycosylase
MPELPEVEIVARMFADHALRQTIVRVRVLDERVLAVPKQKLTGALTGRQFTRVRRHGKHLFADAGDVWLHLHFGMTGDLVYYREVSEEPRFTRVVFDFAEGAHLAFEDMRLFGTVGLTSDPDTFIREHGLGPDPLTIGLREFRKRIAGRRGAIKALLMSQDVIAGIGNLYADETLFQASIDPRRTADRISDAENKAIFTSTRRILREVIARKARGDDHPPRFLIRHREEGDRCPRCGGTIRRTIVGGRTTYYCASHQR